MIDIAVHPNSEFVHGRSRSRREFDELDTSAEKGGPIRNSAYGMNFDSRSQGTTARAQGDSNARRHDQATRSGQRVRIHSRRRWSGVVLSPQRGAGQLRPVERGPAGELRRGAISEGSPRQQRSDRRLSHLLLFDIDGTLIVTGGAGRRATARAFAE